MSGAALEVFNRDSGFAVHQLGVHGAGALGSGFALLGQRREEQFQYALVDVRWVASLHSPGDGGCAAAVYCSRPNQIDH